MTASAFEYHFPSFQEESLPNGLTVLWVPDREQQGVTVALQFPFGKFSDPPLKEALSELVIGLLQKGTRQHSSEYISQQFEQVGASFFYDVGDEHTIVGCRMLARFIDCVLPLFLEIIESPAFSSREFKRLRKEMITAIQAEGNDPGSLATRHFYSQLCGSGHPAGRPHTVKILKSITESDIRQFYEEYMHARGATLVVAGDFSHQTLHSWLVPRLSSWKSPMEPRPAIGEPANALTKNNIRLIDKQDVSQAYIVLGHPVPGELHPARHALAMANYVLGGGSFSSRLMNTIRSRVGRTYSISSQISCDREFGVLTISTATQVSQFSLVLEAILDVYARFGAEGITENELDEAQQYAIGSMAFQLEGIGNVVEKLLWLRLYGRNPATIEQMPKNIESLSLDIVNRAIKEHLCSPGLIFTIVGNKSLILPHLEKYGKAQVFHRRSSVD